jgi:CRP/FNR family cyclic AMP-dependent transcriptional regulator
MQQGQMAQTFKIVKTGSVMVQRSGEDGIERPVALFGAGQSLGTTAMVQLPSSVSVRALTAGRVCEVNIAEAMRRGLVDAEFLIGLAQSYAQTNARLADWARIVRIRGVAGQLAATLVQLAHVQRSTLVRLPSHAVLAGLLCTTRETIARALRKLALLHCVVRRDRWHCEIQREALLSLAGEQGVHAPSAVEPRPRARSG